jgi:hypothetical protein
MSTITCWELDLTALKGKRFSSAIQVTATKRSRRSIVNLTGVRSRTCSNLAAQVSVLTVT